MIAQAITDYFSLQPPKLSPPDKSDAIPLDLLEISAQLKNDPSCFESIRRKAKLRDEHSL